MNMGTRHLSLKEKKKKERKEKRREENYLQKATLKVGIKFQPGVKNSYSVGAGDPSLKTPRNVFFFFFFFFFFKSIFY